MFQTNKQGISQIQAKSGVEEQESIYNAAPADQTVLSGKFSYEPIICNVNEQPISAKSKEKVEKKIQKNLKNTLAFYQEEF